MDGSEAYTDEDIEVDEAPGKPRQKAKQNPKLFQHKWLEMPEFKGWLRAVPDDNKSAKCIACGKVVHAGKSDLLRHSKTARHEKAVKAKNLTPAANTQFRKTEAQAHEENVKKMEVQLAAYYAENNVAFLTTKGLVNAIKKGAKDSKIAQDITLGPGKCAAIVRRVLAKTEIEELVEYLRNTCFSVLVDESTDVSGKTNLCILARYVTPAKKVETRLLELVELDARDCSAESLYQTFKETLNKHEIPITNIIGLACDNAAVMVGRLNSFWTRLKDDCPWAILINCTCHTSALISKHACSELPSFIENHLRSVSSYMLGSPKRCAELEDFQELYEAELKKMLRFSTTRWLVFQPCIQRYLDNKESLLGFFRTTAREFPKDREAALILQEMQNPFLEAYLHFLNYTLAYMNEFNALFQSRGVLIHKLSDGSAKLLKKFCQNFITPSALSRLDTINVSHPSNFVPSDKVYLGPKCTKYLETIAIPAGKNKTEADIAKELRELKSSFKVQCLNFYVRAAREMQECLPLKTIFKEMSFINPAVLLSSNVRVGDDGLPGLAELTAQFGEKLNLDPIALAQEWRTIPIEVEGSFRAKVLAMSVEDAWGELSSLKNFQVEMVFPQLCKLAACVMALPHSNAEAERIFSVVTDTKTKKRNRMGNETLNAIAVVRSSFGCKKVSCENNNFEVTAAHLSKFDSSMYKTAD